MAAINRSTRKRATLTTMATINETLEIGPGLFAAPTGPGLTMEGQDENIHYETDIIKKRRLVAYDQSFYHLLSKLGLFSPFTV